MGYPPAGYPRPGLMGDTRGGVTTQQGTPSRKPPWQGTPLAGPGLGTPPQLDLAQTDRMMDGQTCVKT